MTALEAANAEIRRRAQHEQRRREQRRQAQLPVRTIDALIAELEELHLRGRKRVPEDFDHRLEALNATLPEDCRSEELRSKITIVHLMDRLYGIQDCLFRRQPGRVQAGDGSEDEDHELPQAS
ncbi:MAG TPA: hypothetical protein VN193_03945 [Candidatus Angelobacter sp.]|jgi:hypothetical protein|nr:hypothetical protein [Candidatus Angelobacter sp.]